MITVNDINIRDLGFVASARPQLPRFGGERTVIQQIPGRPGGVRMGGVIEADTLTVAGYVEAPSHATLLSRLDLLAAALQGRCVIRLSDYPDREWVGYLQQGPSKASAIGPAWITRAENVVLQWAIPNPNGRGQVEIAQAPGALALGNAPSPLRIEVQNGGTAAITRVVVEAFANLLHNPGFEEGSAYWSPPSGSVAYPNDPARANSGSRFALVTSPAGTTRSAFHLDGPAGDTRMWPVQPGDAITFGGVVARDAGDGYGRYLCTPYDADGNSLSSAVSTAIRVAEWAQSSGAYTVPLSGVAYVGARCYVNADGALATTARFDDVYLRIVRPGDPRRLLQWDGSVAPGALWTLDADLFQVLNGGANAIDGLTAASEFPTASPGEGGYGYVLVTITGGGGHATTVRYRKRWL